MQKLFHSLPHFRRIDDLGFVLKSANPCVKLLADFHMGGYHKMSFAIWAVENLFSVAETLHSGVQKVVGKADADKLIFTAEHGENTLSVGSHVDFVIGGDGGAAYDTIDMRTYTQRGFPLIGGEDQFASIRFTTTLLDNAVERLGTEEEH